MIWTGGDILLLFQDIIKYKIDKNPENILNGSVLVSFEVICFSWLDLYHRNTNTIFI